MNLWAVLMVVSSGMFAGGAATFAWSRVPIWQRMPLPQFVADFSQTLQWTDKVQPALLITAIVSAIGFTVTDVGAGTALAATGAVALAVTLVASLGILVPLQRRIIASSLEPPEPVEEMRRRWFRGNLGRSAVAVIAFVLVATAAVV